jgi:hypothetical protein
MEGISMDENNFPVVGRKWIINSRSCGIIITKRELFPFRFMKV